MKYLIFFFIFINTVTASSLGVSPSELTINSPLLEQTITKEFIIFNPNPYTLVFEIKDEKNLFDFQPKEGTIIANKDLRIKAKLKPTIESEDLITINSYSMEDQNIQPSLAIKTKITPMSEKIESFEFKEIQPNEDSIYLEILNNGNIKSSAILEIKAQEKIITEQISDLNPGESEEIDVANLPEGTYTAYLTLKNSNKIFSEKQETITISSSNKITGNFLGYSDLDYTSLAIGGIIVILGITAYYCQKFKKKKKRKKNNYFF